MPMEKPAPELVALFDRVLPDAPGVERKRMFGMPAAFVNGNMFMGAMGGTMILRLPPEGRTELMEMGGEPFAPRGPVMREYVAIPENLHGDEEFVRSWAVRSVEFAGALPPKTPKLRRRRA